MDLTEKNQDLVEAYIQAFPPPVQERLQAVRKVIRATAPEAVESISYRMPAYTDQGPLVYFAGYGQHIGFYPTESGIAAFQAELSVYKNAKGSVQFPLDQPLPLDLIARITAFRVAENRQKAEARRKKR